MGLKIWKPITSLEFDSFFQQVEIQSNSSRMKGFLKQLPVVLNREEIYAWKMYYVTLPRRD